MTTQRWTIGPGASAGKRHAVVNLREGGGDSGDVAAMAVKPIDSLKAMARQALAPIHHRGDHGRGLERDGAGKRHVVLGLAHIESGTDQDARLTARAPAN